MFLDELVDKVDIVRKLSAEIVKVRLRTRAVGELTFDDIVGVSFLTAEAYKRVGNLTQEMSHRGTRTSVRQNFITFKHMDQSTEEDKSGGYSLIGDQENNQLSLFDKPLPCCGCGIGWLSLLLGFIFPVMWYYATILYFGNYYQKDPRERTGLAASAIAALIFTIVVLITVAIIVL